MKHRYAAWTPVVVAFVLGYIALSSHISSSASQQTLAADETESAARDSAAESTPEGGHNWTTIVTTAVLIVLAVAVTFVMARLQRRRSEAFQKAAKEDKEARLSARSSPDPDDQ